MADDDGNLTRVFCIASNAGYCQERKINGKRQYLALDPQLASESVVRVKKLSSATIAAFHSSREVVFTRSRDPGNHEFTTCQWNAF